MLLTWLAPALNVQSTRAPVNVGTVGVNTVFVPAAPIVAPVVTVIVPISQAQPVVPTASPRFPSVPVLPK